MSEEILAPEAPVVTPEAPAVESLIDNRRAEVESRLAPVEVASVPEPDKPVETPAVEVVPADTSDPVARIKNAVQKRIDKVIAKSKTIEEENSELKAELERLKSNPKTPEAPAPTSDAPPTPEQVEAYIAKMSEEGNHKEVAAATRYLIKLEKEMAFKEIEERDSKAKAEIDSKNQKQLNQWVSLQKDYEDAANPDLNLSNQKSLLYTTALALYQDKELRMKGFYNDPDTMTGFRLAVADAYREIHQQAIIQTPKGEQIPPRNLRASLADPSADAPEDSAAPSASLSDTDKVREEILSRKKSRYVR